MATLATLYPTTYVQSNQVATILNTAIAGGTTTYTLSPAESGKILLLNYNNTAGGTAVFQVNLPPVATSMGLRYKFVMAGGTQLTGNNILISTAAATAVLRSVVSGNVTASTGGNIAARTTITITPITGGATGSNIGDSLEAFCDGTWWYCLSQVNLVGALTIA